VTRKAVYCEIARIDARIREKLLKRARKQGMVNQDEVIQLVEEWKCAAARIPMMTARRPVPHRHWRSYGDDKLPTGAEALDEPFSAFPSWFLRITCDRCGKDRMLNEAHTAQRDMLIRAIIAKMRHDGCGGQHGRAGRCRACCARCPG
jgi:hypothetical protein